MTIFKKLISLSCLTLLVCVQLNAQDKPTESEKVYNTFRDTRVINTHAAETTPKRVLDLRISHRFGDFISNWSLQNAWGNFIGLENAADIAIGVDYGVTEDLTLGFYRTKGYGPLRQLLHGLVKYRILHQTTDNKIPLTLTAVGLGTMSTMPSSGNSQSITDLPKFAHRFVYSVQLHAARKFSDRFSLQLSPMFTWRNYVPHDESHALFSMNVATRVQLTKTIGLILDASVPFSMMHLDGSRYHVPIGIGMEFETGGHVFQFNLSNSSGIMATDYIPNTDGNWLNGEFRIGFTISRAFRI